MKLAVSRETFLTRLGIAVRGVSTRSAIQTLSGVLLKVEGGSAELQATDMELGVRVSLEAKEAADGAIVLPGRLLLDVVRALPAEDLSLEYRASEHDVELVSGSARFHLRTLPLEDFPKLPEASASTLSVPADAFVDMIGRVARAASRDETRPHLTGVLVTAAEKQLRMVATDSYRLSVKETTLDERSQRLARGERPGPDPPGARPDRERRDGRADRGRRAREPGGLHGRRRGAVVAARGRSIPELSAAPAGLLRARAARGAGELLDVVRRISLLAQKNAPLRLRFADGRARGVGADARRGRGQRVAAGPVRGRGARDRLQPGVLPRRARERRVGRARR